MRKINIFLTIISSILLLVGTSFAQLGPSPIQGIQWENIPSTMAPIADSTYDLGTSAKKWKTVYADSILSGTVSWDQNVETLSGNKTLAITDFVIQKLDPNGSDRDVTLPAEASSTDLIFVVYNTANGAGEDLTVKDDSPATIVSLGPGMGMMFSCDGTSWVALDDEGITYDAVADTVTIASLIAITADINAGTIDGTDIGDDTPGAGNFTALTGKRTASAVDYNPSALTTDYIIAITNTDAARAVTISTEDEDSGTTAQSRIMIVKDESGGAAAHNITVSLESGGNIDGSASYVIDQNYQSITLYIDGTNAWIY